MYSATELSAEVKKEENWMSEELILLLVKEKRYDEAIERYLAKGDFGKAEEFCASYAQKDGLLTKLLQKYFEKYNEAIAERDIGDREEEAQMY